MNRNQNSRFAYNPTNIDIARSKFPRNSTIKTSFNCGDCVPFYIDEILPGDSFTIKTSKLVRLQTLISPIMDNLYLDTYYFFVPNRLVWDHWKNFMGENTESAWIPTTEYEVPQVNAPVGGWKTGSIADYMGIPVNVDNFSVSALPFRAYALIMNEWFRSESLMDPVNLITDDTTIDGSNGDNYITDLVKGGKPFKATKFFDYFTSCLPGPQRGPDVSLDIVTAAPYVYGDGSALPFSLGGDDVYGISRTSGSLGLTTGVMSSPPGVEGKMNLVNAGIGTSGDNGATGKYIGFATKGQLQQLDGQAHPRSGLIADIQTNAMTINALRYAFQLQKLYEKDARSGTRYISVIKSHFGVTSPDSRMQRPEYLGGNRMLINVHQVIQSSESSDTSPQGNTAAYSVTTDVHEDFTHSFTEHGYLIGICVARYDHTYQQGLEKFWSRKDRFDYYWPVFANIGETPVMAKEIYLTGTEADNNVFGYNEAWADYRYKPSRTSGEMRSTASNSLDSWHLGDYYTESPTLSSGWIQEDKANVDRVLAVTSQVSNQIFGDFYVQNTSVRPMPMYSIPGLIDHH